MALRGEILQVFELLRTEGMIGPGKTPSLLEFGEQNWYGDVDPAAIQQWIDRWHQDSPVRTELTARLQSLLSARPEWWTFKLAKVFYDVLLGPHEYCAIDLDGSPAAYRYDLNRPVSLPKRFNLVTNVGTGEHVFNQEQFFRSIHDWTAPGGLMFHYFPNQGCFDHGFYNYHPTFVFDLCEANRYAIIVVAHYDLCASPPRFNQIHGRSGYVRMAVAGQLSAHSGLIAVLQMPVDSRPFSIPMQGYYAGTLPAELRDAWQRLPK